MYRHFINQGLSCPKKEIVLSLHDIIGKDKMITKKAKLSLAIILFRYHWDYLATKTTWRT